MIKANKVYVQNFIEFGYAGTAITGQWPDSLHTWQDQNPTFQVIRITSYWFPHKDREYAVEYHKLEESENVN